MTDSEHGGREDQSMLDSHTADTALDRLLALREDDLDGWEAELARGVPEELRSAAEAVDAQFEALLAEWIEAEEEVSGPELEARDILELDRRVPRPTEAAPFGDSDIVRLRRSRPDQAGVRRMTAALVAALMLVAVGGWILALQAPSELVPGTRTKDLVDSGSATRVDLQFSVEHGPGVVQPGRAGASYGPAAHIAMQLDVRGDGGYLSLLEVDAAGEPRMLYPMGGESLWLDPGSHPVVGAAGEPLVYRPDPGVTGTLRYLALLTREPIDPMRVAPGLLGAGLDRADLWPRPVLAASEFSVDWQ